LNYNKIPSSSLDGVALLSPLYQAKLRLPDDLSPRLKQVFQLYPDMLTLELLQRPDWNLYILQIAEANNLPKGGNQSLFTYYRIPEYTLKKCIVFRTVNSTNLRSKNPRFVIEGLAF
jgi:hypothetical protein